MFQSGDSKWRKVLIEEGRRTFFKTKPNKKPRREPCGCRVSRTGGVRQEASSWAGT